MKKKIYENNRGPNQNYTNTSKINYYCSSFLFVKDEMQSSMEVELSRPHVKTLNNGLRMVEISGENILIFFETGIYFPSFVDTIDT
jgi:hypothetical protein